MSLIEEGNEKKVRMAHLAIVGSHSVNGVSDLHTRILTDELFRDFFEIHPERFNNKTNGITQRRWLQLCNPRLSKVISERLGNGWITNLDELRALVPLAEDADFRAQWRQVKAANKDDLAAIIRKQTAVEVRLDSIFDCQVKRIHEYKRQLLNVLHLIYLYNRIKAGDRIVPQTVVFAGKAAPGYFMAKLIIRLITGVADRINNDTDAESSLKAVLIPNYGVSLAEKIIPAADLSEQISTAGKRSVRHQQYEIRAQRIIDRRHARWRQHRDSKGSWRGKYFHLRTNGGGSARRQARRLSAPALLRQCSGAKKSHRHDRQRCFLRGQTRTLQSNRRLTLRRRRSVYGAG